MSVFLRRLLFCILVLLLTSYINSPWLGNKNIAGIVYQNNLDRIKHQGFIKVLTRFDATTYYEGPDGFTGFEYDLVSLFAEHLGVSARYETPKSFDLILESIRASEADIAAAGLTITEQRQQQLRFTPSYQEITEQVIYRHGNRYPKSAKQLTSGIVEVVKGTSHVDTLRKIKQRQPALEWSVNEQLDTDGLLYLVNEKLIDYTIADSNQFTLISRFYPKLSVAFDISEPRQLAWALPKTIDTSLYDETVVFFKKIKKNKKLAQLIERHFGHTGNFGYVDNNTFHQHYKKRLPAYQNLFQQAGEKYKVDWRLLAAIGYQESHWLKNAISPTGVQGIMMLTNGTARDLGIKDRVDPVQSINGGALYFLQRKKKISKRIQEPDRTWMALASYNVGFGHLEDARIITQQQGASPDKWLEVKARLPLLSQRHWYQRTKHGYARGHEPVRYVENIRNYYDLILWMTKENQTEKTVMPTKKQQPQHQPTTLSVINAAI